MSNAKNRLVALLLATVALTATASGAAAAQAPHNSVKAGSAEGTSAVATFQANHGLPTTGTIDPATGRALQSAPQSEVKDTFQSTYDLPAAQRANARTVIGVGKYLGFSSRGIQIALMTGMTESKFVNYTDAVDHDSLGVFQQRPGAGWGTPAQITNVAYSTSLFFGKAPTGSAPGLSQIDGWETMDQGAAAQAVQVSAYPDRYDEWKDWAADFLATEGPSSPAVAPPAPPA